MKKYFVIIFMLVSSITMFSTEIYGVLDEDTTIGPEGNPWIVTHDLDVSDGITLSILPGSEIFVTSAYSDDPLNFVADTSGEALAKVITVYGNIIAQGTESDSIRFSRYPDYPNFRWGGIRITSDNPEESYFKHCIIECSAVYHDNVPLPSAGIVSNVGLNIGYCRFIDNYFGIYIVDRINSEFTTNIKFCYFDNTTDCYLYYGESDCSIGLSGTNDIIPIVVSRCDFNNIGIDLDGLNSIIYCNFNDISYNFNVSRNYDFYGNHLTDSNRDYNFVYGHENIDGVFRKNTFDNVNDFPNFFCVESYGYKEISDNCFYHSDIEFNLKPDSKFYNNNAEFCDLRTQCNYDEAGLHEIYNNFLYNSSLYFEANGNFNFFNNVTCGVNCFNGIWLDENDTEARCYNNFIDKWIIAASSLTNGEGTYHYNNIYYDRENYVEEHFGRSPYNLYNNYLTYNIPDFMTDCGGNLEEMDILDAGVIIDTLNHTFALSDSSLCIDAGYADSTFCYFDYNYNFMPFDGNGDGIAVADIGPVEYGSYFTIGYVRCIVTDMAGTPLDVIRGEVEGESVEYTGIDGSFLMALPEGTHNLLLNSPFYERDSLLVAINAADTSSVNISLEATYPFVNKEENLIIKNTEIKVYNYPNPFNPTTTISFSIPSDQHVCLAIYNIRGQKVRTLLNEALQTGDHKLEWDGKDEHGIIAGSGVYFYHLTSGNQEFSGKMIMLK